MLRDNDMQVPPIIINMIKNQPVLDKFDLSSVRVLFTGAAPLGLETAEQLYEQYPSWFIRQGYGKICCSSASYFLVLIFRIRPHRDRHRSML